MGTGEGTAVGTGVETGVGTGVGTAVTPGSSASWRRSDDFGVEAPPARREKSLQVPVRVLLPGADPGEHQELVRSCHNQNQNSAGEEQAQPVVTPVAL